MQNHLKKNGTSVDGFFYCPHKPDENCICRKPKSGLLNKAILELNIDVNSSWMIGDNQSDLESAKQVGCNSFLVDEKRNLIFAVKAIIELKNSII